MKKKRFRGVGLADDWSLVKKLDLSAGLRFVVFGVLGGSPYYDLDEEMKS